MTSNYKYQFPFSWISVATALSCSSFLCAETQVFTDREAWMEAVASLGGIYSEDFNEIQTGNFLSDTATQVGDLTFELFDTSGGIRPGTGSSAIDGTEFFQVRLDGNPVQSARMSFPFPVVAWGMDYRHAGDQTHVTFADISLKPIGKHNTSGFIGFVGSVPFEDVLFSDPFISFCDFSMDNLVFVEAPPVFEKIVPVEEEGILSEVQITFGNLRTDASYQLMRTTELESDFTVVDGGSPSESSDVFTDANPPAERAFYRLQVVPNS
ncbi:hypothetical protein AAFN60_03190 [Roseibacillus persicicus]|uniref:hypothetical protein n=1 Tax=Roseibacillus persicicus TaxID=454148 RepID=UPI00398B18D3